MTVTVRVITTSVPVVARFISRGSRAVTADEPRRAIINAVDFIVKEELVKMGDIGANELDKCSEGDQQPFKKPVLTKKTKYEAVNAEEVLCNHIKKLVRWKILDTRAL